MIIDLKEKICVHLAEILIGMIASGHLDTDLLTDHIDVCDKCKKGISDISSDVISLINPLKMSNIFALRNAKH